MNGRIDLSPDDVQDLAEVLDYRLRELEDELVHTDDRQYRESLRAAMTRLEGLRARVYHLHAQLPARREPSPLAGRRPTPVRGG